MRKYNSFFPLYNQSIKPKQVSNQDMLILQACNTRDFTVCAYLCKFTVSNLKTPHPEWLENPGITLACLTSGPSFGTERMNSSIKRLLFLGVAQIITSLCLITVPFVKNYFALLISKFLIYLLHQIKTFMVCFCSFREFFLAFLIKINGNFGIFWPKSSLLCAW